MPAISTIKVSAPGSIMLMGEHAVLYGYRAIACAVDKYMQVSLQPRQDRDVVIHSALSEYQSNLDQLEPDDQLTFVLYAVRQVSEELEFGFELTITSEFSHTVGLGSSAAVTAAVVAALAAYVGEVLDKAALFERALAVVHGVQGRGSGTDLAASVYGGLIAYTVEPRQVESLPGLPPISLVYTGYKTRTPDVLAIVADKAAHQPDIYQSLYQLMHTVSTKAEAAINLENWEALGELMNIYQGLMEALGVNDATLADIIYQLRTASGIQGAKISGSGLGDCVVALGRNEELNIPYESIPVAVSQQGVTFQGR